MNSKDFNLIMAAIWASHPNGTIINNIAALIFLGLYINECIKDRKN